jgi:hypothetical protein
MQTLQLVAQKFTSVTWPASAAPCRVLPSSSTTGASGAYAGRSASHRPPASAGASARAVTAVRRESGIEYSAGVRASSDTNAQLCAKLRQPRGTAGLAVCVLVFVLTACSPALDWRTVELEGLRTVLPCKPDRASRALNLATVPVTMSMAGCEAQGALFAISRVAVPPGADAATLEDAWRAAALLQMQASQSQAQTPQQKPQSPPMRLVLASGRRPDGSPVQASLAWVVNKGVVFHLAVYATALEPNLTEPLVRDLQWP